MYGDLCVDLCVEHCVEHYGGERSTAEHCGAKRCRELVEMGVCVFPLCLPCPGALTYIREAQFISSWTPADPQTQATKNVFAEICDSRRFCHWS